MPLHQMLAEEFSRLPHDAQTQWRRTTAQTGRAALRDVVLSNNGSSLMEIIQQFPGTETAQLARLMVVQRHIDRGHTLAARHWLHTLQSLKLSPGIQRAARDLQNRLPVDEAPDETKQATGDKVTADWKTKWNQPAQIGAVLRQQIALAQQSSSSLDAAWNAVVHDHTIYRRTLRGLVAMDTGSGAIDWALRLHPDHRHLLGRRERSRSGATISRSVADSIRQQVLHDGVLNSVAVGNKAIYVVTARPAPVGMAAAQLGRISSPPDARLVAISKNDGRRLWSRGGAGSDETTDGRLTDAWFAGPPLVDRDLLHCVIQQESELRLMTLRADTGQVTDSTLLAFPDDSIEQHPARRLVAETPVPANGLILCPTTTGWLIAVDPFTRSVVWASQAAGSAPQPDRGLRMNRRLVSRQYSQQQSPRSTVFVTKKMAVMLPWNTRAMTFIDVVSGNRIGKLADASQSGILAKMQEGLVVATQGGRTIRKLTIEAGDTMWERQLTRKDGTPCGPGVVRGTQLMLAMTTGAIMTMDLDTGQVLTATPEVLRPGQRGQLIDTGSANSAAESNSSDLLFVGPDETICLTQQPGSSPTTVTSELVRLQQAAGKTQAAWTTLSRLPPEAFDEDEDLAAIRFNLAFELAASGQLPAGITLNELATNEHDLMRAATVEITSQLTGDPIGAANKAVELFVQTTRQHRWFDNQSATLPIGLVPQRSTGSGGQQGPEANRVRVGMKTWLAQIIEHALLQSDQAGQEQIVLRLSELSTDTLLQIHHPATADAVRAALSMVTHQEETIHLLAHLKSIQPKPDVPGLRDLPAWQNAQPHASERATLQDKYVSALLEGSDPRLDDVSEQSRADWWNRWNQSEYVVVPFARPNPSQRRPYRLKRTVPHDPFLRHFEILVHRVPSRLIIRETAPSEQLIWSIPGAFPIRPGSSVMPTVDRSGTLLLIASADAVSAVSLIEQRVMWRQSGARLINSGIRWVCLHTGQSVDMRDALTGQLIWSVPVTLPNTVFAAEDCVVVHDHRTDTVTTIDRQSGRPLRNQFSPHDVRKTISTVGPDFVLQQQDASDKQTLQIVWQNAVTGAVSRTREIRDVIRIQQDHSTQVVAFRTNGTLAVIDLVSATVRTYDWSAKENDNSGTIPDDDADLPAAWLPDHIRFFEDPEYVYLIRQHEMSPSAARIPERQLTPFRALRVLDRATGTHLWETRLQKSRAGVLVTDQLNLPFLAVIDQAAAVPGGERDRRIRFRCFNKRQGKTLIDCRLPSRYSYDELRISPHQDHSVSVEIHGNHVRFERPGFPSVRRPKPPATTSNQQ